MLNMMLQKWCSKPKGRDSEGCSDQISLYEIWKFAKKDTAVFIKRCTIRIRRNLHYKINKPNHANTIYTSKIPNHRCFQKQLGRLLADIIVKYNQTVFTSGQSHGKRHTSLDRDPNKQNCQNNYVFLHGKLLKR